MSVQDDLATVRRCIDDLRRCVGRLEREAGAGPEARRVRIDADHLHESVTQLHAAAVRPHTPEPVLIPEAPYDRALWGDTDGLDDEGLGARDRHAP